MADECIFILRHSLSATDAEIQISFSQIKVYLLIVFALCCVFDSEAERFNQKMLTYMVSKNGKY